MSGADSVPSARAAHGMAALDGRRLAVFGGRDPLHRTNDLYIYDAGALRVGIPLSVVHYSSVLAFFFLFSLTFSLLFYYKRLK